MQPHVSIIISAFNEEGVIDANVTQVAEYLYRTLGPAKPFEIIVVDDGSGDSTGAVLDEMLASRPYLQVVTHARNFGRGRGIRSGIDRALGRFIVTLDADLSYSPDHILALLEPLERGEADITLASAYHRDGQVVNVPFGRALVSRWGNRLLSASLKGDLRTVTCVVRGYRADCIKATELFSDDKDIHLEVIQKAAILNYRVVEVPAILKWRDAKRSRQSKGMSFGAFQRMATRHLFFNFLFRPSLLLWIPLLTVGIILATVSTTIAYGYFAVLAKFEEQTGILRYYHALGEHMSIAKTSYFVWGMCLLLIFQFFSMLFIAQQSNHHFRDIYSFLTRLNARIKEIERRD